MANLSAKDVATYLLSLIDEDDCGDTVSNLKIQKLVYYAQGFHLAVFDSPLFDDDIEAWLHGPVVPSLYREYKQFNSGAIPPPTPDDKIDWDIYSDDAKDLMKEVWNVFGQFSAWKLRNMTHIEPPWKNTEMNSTISHCLMSDYFKTQLVD